MTFRKQSLGLFYEEYDCYSSREYLSPACLALLLFQKLGSASIAAVEEAVNREPPSRRKKMNDCWYAVEATATYEESNLGTRTLKDYLS